MVKDLINLLVQLQEADSRILERRAFIDKVPLRIHEVDDPLKQAAAGLERMKQKNEALLKKKREREKAVEETQEKIKKMRTRSSDIKTNKEYQAHLKEIEASESEISKIEEDILLVMEELDASQKLVKENQEKLDAEVAKLNAFKRELDDEVKLHEKELDLLKEERAGIVGQLGHDVYNLYMTLLRSGNGVAVTKTKNEVCLGCNMNIPPQLFVEIRKREELIQCPQCRRILYYAEEQEDSSAA